MLFPSVYFSGVVWTQFFFVVVFCIIKGGGEDSPIPLHLMSVQY